MEIHPEPEWEGLFTEFKEHKGTVLILGATDSGKSTLAKYLVKRLTGEGTTVSVVDADVGQSSLGLPGTISMKVFSDEKEIRNYIFEKMFFIGPTNPARKISLMVDGSKKMVDICGEKSDIIFVDTTIHRGIMRFHVGTVLFMSGVGTIVALMLSKWQIGKFIPLFYGSSFSYIAAYLAIATEMTGSVPAFGVPLPDEVLSTIQAGIVVTGLLNIVMGVLIRALGKDKIDMILPPVVTGSIAAIIGFGLAFAALGLAGELGHSVHHAAGNDPCLGVPAKQGLHRHAARHHRRQWSARRRTWRRRNGICRRRVRG